MEHWRTVLAETLTSASSYSSGPLDVGDLNELLVTVSTTVVSDPATYLVVKAVDANENLYRIMPSNIQCAAGFVEGASIGEAFGSQLFGDQIQVDILIPADETVTAEISIKGRVIQ